MSQKSTNKQPGKRTKQAAAKVAKQANMREALFVSALVKGASGTQAAITAGYSEHTAAQIAHQLLRKLHISKAVQESKTAALEDAGCTKEWVTRRLMRIADANIADYHRVEADGSPRVDLSTTTREQMYALARISFKEDGLKSPSAARPDDDGEIEFAEDEKTGKREATLALDNRLAALKLLGQELSMFKENKVVEHKGIAQKRYIMVDDAGNEIIDDDDDDDEDDDKQPSAES